MRRVLRPRPAVLEGVPPEISDVRGVQQASRRAPNAEPQQRHHTCTKRATG